MTCTSSEKSGMDFVRAKEVKENHLHIIPMEPRHEKTGFLHMRKQRRRSASR